LRFGKNANRIISGDETWRFQYDSESKKEFVMEVADIPTTQESSHIEITNEDSAHNFVQYQFTLQAQTVKQAYVEMLSPLSEAVHRKRLEVWPNSGFSAMTMLQFTRRSLSCSLWPKNRLLKWNIPPCSPHLIPNDFWLFTKIKTALKGRRYQGTEDIKKCDGGTESCSTAEVPKMLPTAAKCVTVQREYFKGDPSQ